MVEKNPPQGDTSPKRVLDESRDKEFKKTSLDRETANPESTSETVDAETIKTPLNNSEWTKPPDDLLSGDFSKSSTLEELISTPVINQEDLLKRDLSKPPSPPCPDNGADRDAKKDSEDQTLLNDSLSNAQYYIYTELLNLYNNNNNKKSQSKLSYRLLKRLLSNLVSTNGWDIAHFFHMHVAATKPEIQRITEINWQSVNTTVNIFEETGFLKVLGHVGLPYRTRGRPIPIYGLHHATPEDVTNAQRRYAVHTLGHDLYEREQRRQAQAAEEAEQTRLDAIAAKAEAVQIQKYVDAIASNLDPYHAAPTQSNRRVIETLMKEAVVPEPIWVQVREGIQRVCRRPKEERGR